MRIKFCYQIAKSNIIKNYRCFIPFIIASVSTIFTFLVYVAVSYNTGTDALPINSSFMQFFFKAGKIAIAIFSLFFLTYANNYLMKSRGKEFGLYALMGLKKRDINIIVLFEMAIVYLLALGGASILAFVFGKLVFMAFTWLMNLEGSNEFVISPLAFRDAMFLFAVIFLILYLLNVIKIYTTKIVASLKSVNTGEQEPKKRVLMGMTGIGLMALGYLFALSATSITDFIFIIPIIIVATYIVFAFGSILILKNIMNSKKFYKPSYFVSVTNLMFRMKKNAVSLANLCVLSTGVILVLTIASSVYIGKYDMLRNRFPFDMEITGDSVDVYDRALDKVAKNNDIHLQEKYRYISTHIQGNLNQGVVTESLKWSEHTYDIYIISENDYLKVGGEETLQNDNDIMIYGLNHEFNEEILHFKNVKSKIVKVDSLPFIRKSTEKNRVIYIIARNPKLLYSSYKNIQSQDNLSIMVSGDKMKRLDFAKELLRINYNKVSIYSYDVEEQRWYEYFGGGMFLCIFMGLLLLIFLVLIMYFKQITEGNEDRKQFLILSNVGLTDKEINATIRIQIRLMFFLPFIMASLHMMIISNVVCRALAAFYLGNVQIVLACLGCILSIFFGVYVLIYKVTAKTYLRLIKARN